MDDTHDNNKTCSLIYYSPEDFYRVEKIDAHMHFNKPDASFFELVKADHFRLLTINVNPDYYPSIEEQLCIADNLKKLEPQLISFATTFSMDNYGGEDWQRQTLDYLKKSFASGAIAVKVWKNIGMDVRDKNGKFVMIDDPSFDPVLDFLAEQQVPLIGHLGEPRNCWLPLEKMTVMGDKEYFACHPEYHMYLHPKDPSYEDQINARDNMLVKHPDLKFIGAHLASLEWSVDEIAKRLDKFPNMAVDMAQRISHLQYQAVSNWQRVHDFFIKYQDRIIYATDTEIDNSKTAEQRNKDTHETWLRHWQFFTSDEKMKVPKVDNAFNGIKLPQGVIDKIYRLNAENWFPGILNPSKYAVIH